MQKIKRKTNKRGTFIGKHDSYTIDLRTLIPIMLKKKKWKVYKNLNYILCDSGILSQGTAREALCTVVSLTIFTSTNFSKA